jgi:TRAP-type C4-dicarboxylate transport system permease small subunit
MSITYRKSMDALYLACVGVAGAALVLISAVIPWGVYTRYVVNRAASWPEPMAVLLTIVLTFIGAAACYRSGNHMSVSVLVRMLSGTRQRIARLAAESMVGALAVFMVIYGIKLCAATWHSDIADFPTLSVGLTYLPIPVGGAITLLFVIERMLIGPPPAEVEADREASAMHSPS